MSMQRFQLTSRIQASRSVSGQRTGPRQRLRGQYLSPFRGEEGSALVAAFWMLVVLLLAGLAASYSTTTEVGLSRNERVEAQLFYLAEAGIAQTKKHLNNLGALFVGGGDEGTAPVQVYLNEPIGAAAGVSGTFTAYVDPQDKQEGKPTKYLAITVRARMPGLPIVKVIQERVGQENFAKYAYFTDFEEMADGTEIWFTTNDMLRGPVHSNDQINILGDPVFLREVTSVASSINYGGGPDNPIFNMAGQPVFDVDPVSLPTDLDLLRVKAQETDGLYFTGDAELVLGYDPGTDFAYVDVDQGSGPITYQIPANGVLYVNGNIEIKGELKGQLTVACTGDMWLMDDIVYNTDPRVHPDTADDLLGLVSEQNVIVAATVENLDAGDETFMCSIMALNESFTVENYDTGSHRGDLVVVGGIIQTRRGPVGLVSGEGYSKDYIYDDRLADHPPPSFPTTGKVITLAWRELDPSYDISISVF